MSTRKLSLLTMTAALALTASIGTANAALAAPPPAPPKVSDASGSDHAPEAQDAPAEPPSDAAPSAHPAIPEIPAKPAIPAKPIVKPAAKPGAKSGAKDGTNLAACLDAKCEVEVRDGQEIKIDKKYGAEAIEVDIDGSRATFTIRDGNSKAVTSMSTLQPNSTSSYNGVRISARQAQDDKIILTISHN